jgi:dnd system-associated protein 4
MKNLRVNIDKTKHEVYQKLVSRGAENPDHYPFETMKDLFMLAACLGARHGVYTPMGPSQDLFNSDVFDEKTDVPILFALAYSQEESLAALADPRKVLDIVQCFANGGIDYVVEEIVNNPGRPLNNLIRIISG